MKTAKTVNILIVDDDEVDREALRRGFAKLRIGNPLFMAKDGIEALEMLRGENGKERIGDPRFVLLDLNMPRMTGLECLREMRNDPALKPTIVFVLTTSDLERDKIEAYGLNIAGYIVKTDIGRSFEDAIQMLEHYWRVVEFPAEVVPA